MQLNPRDIKRGETIPILSAQYQNSYNDKSKLINFYKVVTEFYTNAMWSQLPRIDGDENLFKSFEQSTIERSINGIGAVVKIGDSFTVPSGRYVWEWQENGDHVGWIVGWPYNTEKNTIGSNHMRIFIFEDEKPLVLVQDWEIQGTSFSSLVSQTIVPGLIGVWGNHDSDYTQMGPLVNALNNRLDLNNTVLDKHSNPHMEGPAEAVNEQGEFPYNKEGMFLPTTPDQSKYNYLTWDSPENLNMFTVNTLMDILHIITGVPATAFGLSQENNQSGKSRERQMFAAISKVKRWRRQVENAMMPFGVSNVKWIEDPFVQWSEQVATEIILLENGIISVEEARQRLNIG